MGELADILRRNEAQIYVSNAHLVADFPDERQRIDAARMQIHLAMYRAALGQITEDEKQQILQTLAPFCPDMCSAVPAVFPHLTEDAIG